LHEIEFVPLSPAATRTHWHRTARQNRMRCKTDISTAIKSSVTGPDRTGRDWSGGRGNDPISTHEYRSAGLKPGVSFVMQTVKGENVATCKWLLKCHYVLMAVSRSGVPAGRLRYGVGEDERSLIWCLTRLFRSSARLTSGRSFPPSFSSA